MLRCEKTILVALSAIILFAGMLGLVGGMSRANAMRGRHDVTFEDRKFNCDGSTCTIRVVNPTPVLNPIDKDWGTFSADYLPLEEASRLMTACNAYDACLVSMSGTQLMFGGDIIPEGCLVWRLVSDHQEHRVCKVR